MTVFEILNFNRELINRLCRIGFKPEDCRYIDLYSDYERMKNNGEKVKWNIRGLFETLYDSVHNELDEIDKEQA